MIIRDDEYQDFAKVPESRGIPAALYRIVVVGIVIIFAIGAAVVLNSGYGHHWPSETTLRIPLQ
jgi:hypothetical protein